MESLLLIFPARAIVQRMPAQWAKKCANALHCTFGGPQLCQCNLAFESHDVANTFNLLRLPNLRMRKPKSSPLATWLERLFIWGQDLFEASAL